MLRNSSLCIPLGDDSLVPNQHRRRSPRRNNFLLFVIYNRRFRVSVLIKERSCSRWAVGQFCKLKFMCEHFSRLCWCIFCLYLLWDSHGIFPGCSQRIAPHKNLITFLRACKWKCVYSIRSKLDFRLFRRPLILWAFDSTPHFDEPMPEGSESWVEFITYFLFGVSLESWQPFQREDWFAEFQRHLIPPRPQNKSPP